MFADAEASLHRNLITPESKRKYISAFGKTTIAHHLLDGLKDSMWREYENNRPPELQTTYSDLYSFIEHTEKALNESN